MTAVSTATAPASVEVLAFDVYGTLVDPIRVWTRLQEYAPDRAIPIAELWRQKQLEYSFRLTVMGQYYDFEWVTARALEYALAATGVTLSPSQVSALLAQYDALDTFEDVRPGLEALQASGRELVVFSNGSPRMLDAVLASSGLTSCFSRVVSVHDVRAFKPSPRVYQHLADTVGRPPNRVLLVSSNPFDIIGGLAAGLQAAWINRAGAPFDTIAPPPPLVVRVLTELAEAVSAV